MWKYIMQIQEELLIQRSKAKSPVRFIEYITMLRDVLLYLSQNANGNVVNLEVSWNYTQHSLFENLTKLHTASKEIKSHQSVFKAEQ